jgi:hypothetical protein
MEPPRRVSDGCPPAATGLWSASKDVGANAVSIDWGLEPHPTPDGASARHDAQNGASSHDSDIPTGLGHRSSSPVSVASHDGGNELTLEALPAHDDAVSLGPASVSASLALPFVHADAHPPTPPEPGSNLFVAGLAPTVNDKELERAFANFGEIVSAKVMLHVETAVSRGFGFVLFRRAADAMSARTAMHGRPMPDGHGGRLQVSVSKHRGENLNAESKVVYVRNVPTTITTSELEVFFGRFGLVEKLQVRGTRVASCSMSLSFQNMSSDQPQHVNTAEGSTTLANIVVEFRDEHAARDCVAATHGRMPFAQCTMPLLAKLEEPQTLREQRLKSTRQAPLSQSHASASAPAALPSVPAPTLVAHQPPSAAYALSNSGIEVAGIELGFPGRWAPPPPQFSYVPVPQRPSTPPPASFNACPQLPFAPFVPFPAVPSPAGPQYFVNMQQPPPAGMAVPGHQVTYTYGAQPPMSAYAAYAPFMMPFPQVQPMGAMPGYFPQPVYRPAA